MELKEVGFKPINNVDEYDNCYCVSPKGTVVSPSFVDRAGKLRKGKVLAQHKRGKGYLYVGLMKNGKQIGVSVHRLVAEAFIPNPENKSEVNHINGIKTDNRVENLEWVTPSENVLHAFRTGLRKPIVAKGEQNNKAKLTDSAVIEIRKSDETAEYLSKKYDVSKSAIYKVRQGVRWKHLLEK